MNSRVPQAVEYLDHLSDNILSNIYSTWIYNRSPSFDNILNRFSPYCLSPLTNSRIPEDYIPKFSYFQASKFNFLIALGNLSFFLEENFPRCLKHRAMTF